MGIKPYFPNPEMLWAGASEYFDFVEANPLFEAKVFCNKDGILDADVPKMRAMSVRGLCVYLDISTACWSDYTKREGFEYVCEKIENVIWVNKFEGAAAGLLNATMIIRDLGLKESTEISGPNGGPIETVGAKITYDMDAETAAEIYRDLMR